ncbi:hypothetical protein O181_065260 [Austropuccinia psidii MF-1]|uniref:Uncharacterized protein n=1 Tax=Austropuccinia psidii MF-1 TaxID=1389203 RepID=A0A9Q3EUR3_9BASI|nr:hypothetical protein [Austropuccinia psidii MF-1]
MIQTQLLDPSKLVQPTQLSRRSSNISSISSFKSGPFSATAFALCLTDPSKPKFLHHLINSSRFEPIRYYVNLSIWKSHQSDPHLTSLQEDLYQTVISLNNQSNPIIKTTNISTHQRKTSAQIAKTGVFICQQLTYPINPPQSFVLPLPVAMNSSSTTDSP